MFRKTFTVCCLLFCFWTEGTNLSDKPEGVYIMRTEAAKPTKVPRPTRTSPPRPTTLPTSTITPTLTPTAIPLTPTSTPTSPSTEPYDLLISDITDDGFVISYLTTTATTGVVHLGETPDNLNQRFGDSRGGGEYFLHYIQVSDLDPETSYYFVIVSGNVIYNNSGSPITTGPILTIPAMQLVYGQVVCDETCTVPANEAIVYGWIVKADDSSYSQLLSALIYQDNQGWWGFNLAATRDIDNASYFLYSAPRKKYEGDWLWLIAMHSQLGTSGQVVIISPEEIWWVDDFCLN